MDETLFLNEIASNPDDDTVKLVYADWLDEQGDPRGQMIRLSVELRKKCQHFISESDTERAFNFGQWMKALKIPFEPKTPPDYISIPTPLVRSVEINRDAESLTVNGLPRYVGFRSYQATIEIELDSQAAAEIAQIYNT